MEYIGKYLVYNIFPKFSQDMIESKYKSNMAIVGKSKTVAFNLKYFRISIKSFLQIY